MKFNPRKPVVQSAEPGINATGRKRMKSKRDTWIKAAKILTLAFCAGGTVAGQGLLGVSGAQHAQGSQSQQPPAQQSDKSKTPDVTPLTLDTAAPVSTEEDAAYKAFFAVPPNDSGKKIELGEAFIQKYPESRYKSPVYGALTFAYMQVGNMQKMQEVGEKEIALAPNDVSTLALMGQALPRTWKASAPDASQVLVKAEQYSKQAIEITPTLPKPESMTEEAFASAKNQTLAMAHSGLGLGYGRLGKNAEALAELEQAVKIDPAPDPVNYYLLGMANKMA